jgi:hypothetical protein
MTMVYELWDLGSGNQIGSYPSEPEALAAARRLVDTNSPDFLGDLALGAVVVHEGREPELLPFVEGDELRARIKALPAAPSAQQV